LINKNIVILKDINDEERVNKKAKNLLKKGKLSDAN